MTRGPTQHNNRIQSYSDVALRVYDATRPMLRIANTPLITPSSEDRTNISTILLAQPQLHL